MDQLATIKGDDLFTLEDQLNSATASEVSGGLDGDDDENEILSNPLPKVKKQRLIDPSIESNTTPRIVSVDESRGLGPLSQLATETSTTEYQCHPEVLPDVKAGQTGVLSNEKHDEDNEKSRKKCVWIEQCIQEWGMVIQNPAISSRFSSVKMHIHVHGSFGSQKSGCGAMLREQSFRPLVAWSSILSEDQCISVFYSHLKGVSLGLKIASKYQILGVNIHCNSNDVCRFINHAWSCINFREARERERESGSGRGRGRGGGRGRGAGGGGMLQCGCADSVYPCKECMKVLLQEHDKKDIEMVYSLLMSIISDVMGLRELGLFQFRVSKIERGNAAAVFLANLGEDNEMNISEIFLRKDLSDILYDEAHDGISLSEAESLVVSMSEYNMNAV